MTLFKLSKIEESKSYIETAVVTINSILDGTERTKITKLGQLNLYGLISISQAAV